MIFLLLIIIGLASGGSSDVASGGNATINQVDILIPYPKGEEALVNSIATLALHYDYVAQAYVFPELRKAIDQGEICYTS